MAQQESIRAVDLPALPELSESEVGPLVAVDWMTTIGPFLRDMGRGAQGGECSISCLVGI